MAIGVFLGTAGPHPPRRAGSGRRLLSRPARRPGPPRRSAPPPARLAPPLLAPPPLRRPVSARKRRAGRLLHASAPGGARGPPGARTGRGGGSGSAASRVGPPGLELGGVSFRGLLLGPLSVPHFKTLLLKTHFWVLTICYDKKRHK